MISILVLAGHIAIVVSFSVRILIREDISPPGRLAWFIVLLVLPLAGASLYFLFGETDVGHRQRHVHHLIFNTIRAKRRAYMGLPDNLDTLIDPLYRSGSAYAASINGFFPVAGNKAEVLDGPADYVTRLLADIDAATDHVHVLSYIWLTDDTGTAVADALIHAATRGVTCRAIADAMGSRGLIRSDLWQRMLDAGVMAKVALPVERPLLVMLKSRIDLRNHRKIAVIDSKITYCGSRNTADPAFRPKPHFAPWVDIMLRFQGPVVAQNQLLFASDWMSVTGEPVTDIPVASENFDGGFAAQVLGDGPTERFGATPQLFSVLFSTARDRLTLSTPYFVPDATVVEALCAAAHRGTQVTLIFPERNDSRFVAAASRSFYRRLLRAGCRIFEYQPGLLHAKTLTIDGVVSLVGSTNLDLRSFDLNYENNILLESRDITSQIETHQKAFLADSVEINLLSVMAWPTHRKILNNMAATVGPLL